MSSDWQMAQLSIQESEAVCCSITVVGGRLYRDPSKKGHYNFLPSQSDQGRRDFNNETLGLWVALLKNRFWVFRSIKIEIQNIKTEVNTLHTSVKIKNEKSSSRPPGHQLFFIQILESAPNKYDRSLFEC